MKVLVVLVHQPVGSLVRLALMSQQDMAADLDLRRSLRRGRVSPDGNSRWVKPGVTRQRYGGVMSKLLDLIGLKAAAAEFAESLRDTPIPELFGTTDGKALGTWIEANFNEFLAERHA